MDNSVSIVTPPQFVVNVVQVTGGTAGFSVLAGTTNFVVKVMASVGGGAGGEEYTQAEKDKLAAIEALAKDDQTGPEIKALYELENDTNAFTDLEKAKLDDIESDATADQTGLEIKTAYELEADTNAYTDIEKSKLAGIMAGATDDLTGAEIKVLYELEAQTNAFTDTEKSKLAAIEAGATTDQTDAEIRTAVEAASDSNVFTDADHTKLDAIEAGAKDDQTGAEIKTLYQGETNAYTDTKDTKLAGIDTGAKDDQTGVEIKTAYELEPDTNAYDDAAVTKLAGIATGADVSPTPLTNTQIKTQYEANADTNVHTDAQVSKLAAIEASATADQTDSEIETAYNAQVAQVSGPEITAGTEILVRRVSPADIKAFVLAHETGGSGATAADHVALTPFTPILTDISRGVDDPAGTPVFGKVTYAQIRTLVEANLVNPVTSDNYAWGTDLFLERDEANALALRNGTNAQALRIYNTFTDGLNYERLNIEWGSDVCLIQPEDVGTGSSRALKINFWSGGSGAFLTSTGANTLQMINGLVGQSLFIYNSDDGAGAVERGMLRWNADVFQIGMQNFGAGSRRNVEIAVSNQTWVFTHTSGDTVFPGKLLFSADGTDDIGNTGANRPRRMHLADVLKLECKNVNISALQVTGHSITGANGARMIDLEGTWNTTGAPAAIWLNIVNTASDAASKLMDLRVGSASKFAVGMLGDITLGSDTTLIRDAAHTFAQRNGTNVQTHRIYKTFTDAANYERVSLGWDGADFLLMTEKSGTGSATELAFGVSGTKHWKLNTVGHLIPVTGQNIGDTSTRLGKLYLSDVINNALVTNTSALIVTGYNVTTAGEYPMFDLSGTWNTSGVPTAFKLDILDNASGVGSMLMELLTGGAARFTVYAHGGILGDMNAVNTTALHLRNHSVTGTSSTAMLKFAGTWDTTGLPTGIRLDILDTASSGGSLLLDLQVNSTSVFNVNKVGTAIIGNLKFKADNTFDIGEVGASRPRDIYMSGNLRNVDAIIFGDAENLVLIRDGADLLAQRRGTNAQTSHLYNFYIGGTDYERATFGWSGNTLKIGTEFNGTGVARNMSFMTGGVTRFSINSGGHWVTALDNTYDIGQDGNSRNRDLFLAGALRVQTVDANKSSISVQDHSITGSDATAMVSLTGTWDTTGAPRAILLDMLDTASDAGALLMELKVGGVAMFSVSKAGHITAVSGLGGAPAQVSAQEMIDGTEVDLRSFSPDNVENMISIHGGSGGSSPGITDNATANVLTIDASNRILFGTTLPDVVGGMSGSMTISTGNSGQATAAVNADELIIESSGLAGISILTPNNTTGRVVFGDPENNAICRIVYSHVNDNLTFVVNNQTSLILDSGGRLSTGNAAVDLLGNEKGAMTVSTGNSGLTSAHGGGDDFIIENNVDVGLTLAAPNTASCAIYFADPENNDAGIIKYNHNDDSMAFLVNAGVSLVLDSTNRIITGTSASDALGAEAGSMTISTGDSGQTTVNASADDLIIENNDHVGITLLSPNTKRGAIFFGDPESNARGQFRYDHADDTFSFYTAGIRNLAISSGLLELQRGTNPQELFVYNTFTDAANYERGGLSWNANVLRIGTGNAGTGAIRELQFRVGGSIPLRINSANRIMTGLTVTPIVGGGSGALTVSTGVSGVTTASGNSDDLIIEGSGNSGMTIACPNTVKGFIQFADPESNNIGRIIYDHSINAMELWANGGEVLTLDSARRVITGGGTSDALGAQAGSMTISTGDSGATTVNSAADDFIIENSISAGMTILTGNTATGSIFFGDPEGGGVGRIKYDHNIDAFQLTTNNSLALTIDSAQRILTGSTLPDVVGSKAGSMTISTGDSGVTTLNSSADDLTIESFSNGGLTIATPNNAIGAIHFTDPETAGVGQILYDHALNQMAFAVSGVKNLFLSSSLMEQRRGTSAQTLHVYNTYTDSSNYERVTMRFSSNLFEFGTQKAGTGLGRDFRFLTDGTARWRIQGTLGHFLPIGDGVYDLASLGNRVRNVFVSGKVAAEEGMTVGANHFNVQTGTSYDLVAADNGKTVTLNNAAAIVLTVPAGLGIGFRCTLLQLGAGQVTVTASSTTLNSLSGFVKIAGQHGVVGLLANVADTFALAGDLVA